jgi:GT2 family glycosyltransferase
MTRQTRPPIEIIVVDGSRDWEQTRVRALDIIEKGLPGCRVVYEGARVLSLCCQRNQAIAHSTADVLMLLDDDSLMYPSCAERVMQVYEADSKGEVAGVCASLAAPAPDEPGAESDSQSQTTTESMPVLASGSAVLSRLADLFRSLLAADLYLPPYKRNLALGNVPESCKALPVSVRATMHGCRMTFRRSVCQKTKFEETLRGYSYLEDVDFSYRASVHGVFLNAHNAKLCHAEAPGGRQTSFSTAATSALNPMVLHSLHAQDRMASKWLFVRTLPRRAVFFLLKDAQKRRWSLPGFRGMVYAVSKIGTIFAKDRDELRLWYPELQAVLRAKK